MGDEGTSTHVLVDHRNAENELEGLQLTKSDKFKPSSSKTKFPSQEVKRREPAKRFHVKENQSLDVVELFAESISANFTVLTESMINSFQKLVENLNVMNDNIMSLVHWPEGELSEDISEQVVVNEASEGFEKHPNDGKKADESATGQAEPSSKRKRGDESVAEEGNSTSTPNKILSSLEKKANAQEATGPKKNDILASHVTAIMRQKPEEEGEKNSLQKILRPENCPGLSKITVNQVIWGRVLAEARTGDVKMQRVQKALVKGTTNVALIADLVWKSSEDKDNIDTTALLDKLWKLTEDSLSCLGSANWELVQRLWEASKPQIMLICVLKKSSLLTLCLEMTLPSKSKMSQMIIKLLISCWTKTNLGTEPPMQTGALVVVVQVFEGPPFEDEVQEHPTNPAQQPTAGQSTTRKHLRTNSEASGKYSSM